MVDSQMDLSPGITVLGTLSGRTPLYRLEAFFWEKDTESILGNDVKPELFCDYNVGCVLDKLYDTGTQKLFSQITQNGIGVFDLYPRRVHVGTTSISVFRDYDFVYPPLKITYGHSKDKRPDLKQFLVSMLCVDRNIPILGSTENGNPANTHHRLHNEARQKAKYPRDRPAEGRSWNPLDMSMFSEITGWKNRPTKRPTYFMMTTKILSILVSKS